MIVFTKNSDLNLILPAQNLIQKNISQKKNNEEEIINSNPNLDVDYNLDVNRKFTLKKISSLGALVINYGSNKTMTNSSLPTKFFKFGKDPSPKNTLKSRKSQDKIETIVDGFNDSFINELEDLLNNVENRNTNCEEFTDDLSYQKKEVQIERGNEDKIEIPSHKIRKEELKNLSNKRFKFNLENKEEEIEINLKEHINKNADFIKDEDLEVIYIFILA
jgi:hypothetical protein